MVPGRIRVTLLLQSSFEQAALPPLLMSDPFLEVVDRSAMPLKSMLFSRDPAPHVVVVASRGDEARDCSIVRALVARFAVPVVVLVPRGVDPGAEVACLQAGAVETVRFDPGPSESDLLGFQHRLVGRIRTFFDISTMASAFDPARAGAARPVSNDNEGTLGAGNGRLSAATRQVVGWRPKGKPRSPLEPEGGWTLVTPARGPGRLGGDTDGRAEVIVFLVGLGGVAAFSRIVRRLEPDTRVGALAVVRLSVPQLQALARRLDAAGKVSVRVAREGASVAPGVLLLAPPGRHLALARTGRVPRASCRLDAPDPGSVVAPRMDTVLRAAARIYGVGTVAVVLSGVDTDGMAGLEFNRRAGGRNLVMDPRDAGLGKINLQCIESGLADAVLSAGDLARRLVALGEPLLASNSAPPPRRD